MRRLLILSLVTTMTLAFSANLLALQKPTGKDAKQFVEFLYHGRTLGPILSDIQFCQAVSQSENDQSPCDFPTQEVRAGDQKYIWIEFILPQGADDLIRVELRENGVKRFSKDYEVKGSLRYWVYEQVTLDKPGQWKVEVFNPRKLPQEKMGEATLVAK